MGRGKVECVQASMFKVILFNHREEFSYVVFRIADAIIDNHINRIKLVLER